MEMEEGRRPCSGAVDMPVTALQNGSVRVLEAFWRTEVSECWRGYDCWAIGLVSWVANGSIQTIGRPQHSISGLLIHGFKIKCKKTLFILK